MTAHICAEGGTCETKLLAGATSEPRFGEIFQNDTITVLSTYFFDWVAERMLPAHTITVAVSLMEKL